MKSQTQLTINHIIRKMTIKKIEDLKDYNILCTNLEQVVNCFNILEDDLDFECTLYTDNRKTIICERRTFDEN